MSNNLLSKPILPQVNGDAYLYVVYNNQDYRSTLSALLALVTRASLGLDRVNNTNDLEKPISTATQDALNALTQANATLNAQLTDLTTLVNQKASIEQLNQAIATLNTAIQGRPTAQEMSAAISAALQPINTSITTINDQLAGALSRITALEQTGPGGVSQQYVDDAIAALDTSLRTVITDVETSLVTDFNALSTTTAQSINALSLRVTAAEQAIAAINTALEGKADRPVSMDDIDGLEAWIQNYMDALGLNVRSVPGDW